MKKILLGFFVIGVLFLSTACGTIPEGSGAMIIGKWTVQDPDGKLGIFDFNKNGKVRIATYEADGTIMKVGGLLKADNTVRYSISGNELTLHYGMGITQVMTFDLSTPGVIRFENYMGQRGLKGILFNLDALTPGSETVISGQWLYDDGQGTSTLWDFKTNTQVQLVSYLGGAKTMDRTLEYRISENNLIVYSFEVMPFDLSTPGLLKLGNYAGIEGANVQFYNFDGVQLNEFRTLARADDIESALKNAANAIMASIQQGSNIAISNISTEDASQSNFVANELEFILLNAKLSIVDRSQLDVIRREQNLQLSGDVADDEIVSIGKFAGAKYIITGSISGSDTTRRLRLRLLDTETAMVITAASERF